MMRFEETRVLPVSPKVAWDYLCDPSTWAYHWNGLIEVRNLESLVWEKPGDTFHAVYRLLGRHLDLTAEMLEIQPHDYMRYAAIVPGIPKLTQEWFYSEGSEPETTVIRVVSETEESDTLFGKIVDRTVMPLAVRRDLQATLDNIEEVFALGMTAPE